MIGTEFLKGQGLGNQLFCYVTSRCIALDKGCEFGTAGQKEFANNIHSRSGMYFMDIDLGVEIADTTKYTKYYEKEERIFLRTSSHDMTKGCMIAGVDWGIREIEDNTLIYGNMQSEEYFIHHLEEIKSWLKIRPEFESLQFTDDKLCVLNMRGGEYVTHKELYLDRAYWIHAMEYMKKKISGIRFVIITEDVKQAKRLFPEMEVYHLGMGEDYVALKNAKHLILSNSSFAVFPALTSDMVETIVAPKYWARYNVSNGYWASRQNIYSSFTYLDRKGCVFTAKECRDEYENYKQKNQDFVKLMTERRKRQMDIEFRLFCKIGNVKNKLLMKKDK